MAEEKLIYNVEDKPKFSKLIVFAFQQVLAVLAATVAVPAMIGLPADIPAAILGGGVGTLIYLLITKFKSPVILSSSFAFLGALTHALAFGYMGIALGSLFAGLVYVVIAIIIHFVGTKWVSKLMPAVIIGPVVAIIGLSLSSNSVSSLTYSDGSIFNNQYNLVALFIGIITFLTIVFCSCQNKFKSLKTLPFLIGIFLGFLISLIFTGFGYLFNVEYLKIINFDYLVNNFNPCTINSFFSIPHLSLVEGIKELATGEVSPEILASYPEATPITWLGVAEVALAFIPVSFVSYAEHVADHINLGKIIDKDLLNEEPGMKRTLLGDGLGSIFGAFFGICPNTTYGESVGCIAVTKNASVRTIVASAFLMIILAFIAPVTALLRTIPTCVVGGIGLALYGYIAVSGLSMIKDVNFDDKCNFFTISAILITGIGGLTLQIPYSIKNNAPNGAITLTTVVTALIMGLITYRVANKSAKLKSK